MSKKAVILRGDGIGPQLVDCMMRVLNGCNMQSEVIMSETGSEQWDKNGRREDSYIPSQTMAALEECDACFKAPTTTIPVPNAPRSVAVTLRQKFNLYANIRPIKTYERVSPGKSLDCVCFREATEGLYTGIEAKITDDVSIAVRKITRSSSRRLLDAAVKWALSENRKKIVCITKRNILRETDGVFWSEAEKAVEGTGLELVEYYIDNMAQQLVIHTDHFDGTVLVSTNLFMDIISELASTFTGSIGMVYSANMGDDYAMFEAAHGSAPKLVGENRVNPTAAVLSGAWMAGYLGEQHIQDAIFKATSEIINEGKTVTKDIGGTATTDAMADVIAERSARLLHR